MPLNISVDILSPSSIARAIDSLEAYRKGLKEKARLIVERLSVIGAVNASMGFSRAVYNGQNDAHISTRWINGTTVSIDAQGSTVLFIEFGSGITYGYGHPDATEHSMGPGTYPSEKHLWNNPKGWWFTNENGESQHSYGNPPNAPMYHTRKEILQEVSRVAREVFASG